MHPLRNLSQFEEIQIKDQICSKNMSDKNFEKINIKIVINI